MSECQQEMKTPTDCSLLWEAARLGDLKTVQKFVSINPTWVRVCDTKNNNWTALCYACNHRHLPVIRYLLEKGSDKNHADNFSETPITRATKRGFTDVERLLLTFKQSDPETKQTNTMNPTKTLTKDTNGELILFDEADSRRNVGSKSSLCDVVRSTSTSRHSIQNESDGTTPHSPRDVVVIECNETSHPDKDTDQSVDISTATTAASLRAFCAEGNVEAVHRLLDDYYANDQKNNNNNNNTNLLKHCTAFGSTLLHIACWYGHANIVRELLRRGARLDATNKAKATPLHLACWRGHETVVLLLLRPRFRWYQIPLMTIHAVDKQGWTPLHRAAVKGHVNIIRHLLRAGANPLRCTKNGQKPYDCVPVTYEFVRLVIKQAEQEFRYKHQAITNSQTAPTTASSKKEQQEKQQQGPVIARVVRNPTTAAEQENNAQMPVLQRHHVPLARVVAIEPLVYHTNPGATSATFEYPTRIPVDPPEQVVYNNLPMARPCSSSSRSESEDRHLHHREATLIKWKELKLTEIQQAMDLAKLLCPNPDPSNKFWKQVLARQEESQTIEEELQKLLLLTDIKN